MDSQILTGLQLCEEYLNLRHNYNIIPLNGAGKGIEKGAMFHAILQHYYIARRDGKNRDEQFQEGNRIAKLFIEGCQYCIAGMDCPDHKERFKGLESLSLDEAYEVVNTFRDYHEFWKNDTWSTISTEIVKGAVIYEDDELSLLWKAKIDWLVDDMRDICSVDHKTAGRREETLDLNNQFMGQCVVTKQSRMYINKIGMQKTLKPEEKFERQCLSYTKDRIAEWINETASYAYDLKQLQEAGQYRHKMTSCFRRYGPCMYRPICSTNPNDRDRVIKEKFKIAERVWDIGNEE